MQDKLPHSRPRDDFQRGHPDWNWLGLPFGLAAFIALLLLPTPDGLSPAAHRLAAATVLMAVLWVSQVIPIAATSLIPLAAYPLLGIQSANDVATAYVNANIFLFFGGFVIALGIEKWGLHRRIALHVVHVIGGSPPRIVLGFMTATAFLSMWISNTATTMLMLPIAIALLRTLGEVEEATATSDEGRQQSQAALSQLGIGLMLGIAYGASSGGLSTLVGTPTNVTFLGQWKQLFPDAPDVSMGEWLPVFLPLTGLMLLFAYLSLTWRLPRHLGDHDPGRGFFRERIRALGKPSSGEWAMLIVFISTALLWVFRKPLQFRDDATGEVWTLLPGWGTWYESLLTEQLGVDALVASGAVHDATVAMTMALLLFVFSAKTKDGTRERLIDWDTVEHKMPWGIVLLLGGGFAMAGAFHGTGLSEWLGETLATSLAGTPLPVLVFCICLMMTFLTEFTSNVATVSTLLPILAGTAVTLGVDPRLLMIPATVTASCAFMLPIATPPNAIVFASGRVSMGQMMRHGLILNLLGVVIVTAVTFWLLIPIMGISLETMPDWAVPPVEP
ncbi:MAG: SLC13/DASS family transporter [Planctomycetaceae bacterium]|nr:SLC13/DASS family transporter [Planctomycetaceae bacterium]